MVRDRIDLPDLLIRLWRHLGRRRRWQFGFSLGLMLASAFAEVISLGAVLPFLGVLVAPERVFSQPVVARAANAVGVETANELVWLLALLFAMAAVIAGGIRILLAWVSARLSFAAGADLSIELYRRTLYQPYPVHLSRNSSEVVSAITQKVGIAVGVLSQAMLLISSTVLLVAIVGALFAIEPMVATLSFLGFGGSYAIVAWMSRLWLRRNSSRIAAEQTRVVKSLQEGLGGIRDVLLDGTQEVFCDAYRKSERPLRRAQGENVFMSLSPRHAMEALGIALIAVLALAMSSTAGGVTGALPVLGALALGAQRLLPALQGGYSAWANIVGYKTSLADTLELLDQPVSSEMMAPPPPPLRLRHGISLESVRFRYASDGPWVLDGVDLRIDKGARVGIVGTTGSGKSTLLDILMGLLTATEGRLLVDDEEVSGNQLRAWQRSIAHVPQSIYLADATMAENIAFGVPFAAIDMQLVVQAARQAQIADFIEGSPGGYLSTVGERGVRLSGGQRQRIGIARALYRQASVLVFDEATSALDNQTEDSVMRAIDELDRGLTIVLIAHRLSTVRRCGRIVELDSGRVRAQGTYEELLAKSPSFRRMAGTGLSAA